MMASSTHVRLSMQGFPAEGLAWGGVRLSMGSGEGTEFLSAALLSFPIPIPQWKDGNALALHILCRSYGMYGDWESD